MLQPLVVEEVYVPSRETKRRSREAICIEQARITDPSEPLQKVVVETSSRHFSCIYMYDLVCTVLKRVPLLFSEAGSNAIQGGGRLGTQHVQVAMPGVAVNAAAGTLLGHTTLVQQVPAMSGCLWCWGFVDHNMFRTCRAQCCGTGSRSCEFSKVPNINMNM